MRLRVHTARPNRSAVPPSAAAAFLCMMAAACMVPLAVAPPPEQAVVVPAPAEHAEVARGVVAEANRVRREAGLPGLVDNDTLARAALEHARELAQTRVLDHTSRTPGRETVTLRIEAAGGTWRAAAENLAQTHGAAARVPAEVVRMWQGSPGHHRNVFSDVYTHTGVGVAVDTRGYWYVVQLYVRPPAAPPQRRPR